MQEEPFFFINDFLENRGEFENILNEIKKRPEEYTYKAQFLRNFVNGMYLGYVNKGKTKHDEKERLKQELANKKRELLARIEEMKKQEVKVEIPVKIENKKDLILSKFTKSPIVSRLLDKEYNVVEPVLSNADKVLVDSLKSEMNEFNEDNFNSKIREKLGEISPGRFDTIRYYTVRDLKSFGQVSPFLEDDEVQEVICDGINQALTVNLKDKKNVKTNIMFKSDKELNDQIYRFAKLTSNTISDSSPFMNGPLNTNFMVDANLSTQFFPGKFVIKRI